MQSAIKKQGEGRAIPPPNMRLDMVTLTQVLPPKVKERRAAATLKVDGVGKIGEISEGGRT